MKHLFQLFLCLGGGAVCLYSYLQAQNDLVRIKMDIPLVEKELRSIREETQKLAYQVEQFQSPNQLMEKLNSPEFAHLRHPPMDEIIHIPEVYAAIPK